MFSTPESGKISERWTSVQIEGGDDLDEEGRAFMARYELGGYPSLLAVTASGALIDRDLADGRMRNAEYLYTALEKAEDVNRRFLELRTKLLAEGDVASRAKLAELYVGRLELARAAELYEQVFEEAPTDELVQRRLILLARMGERDAEQKLLEDAITRFPEAEERIGWRMRRATLHIEPPRSAEEEAANITRHVEALETLRAEVAEAADVEAEATVRIAIARLEHGRRQTDAAQAQLDWIFEHAPEGRAARVGHLVLAQQALEKRDAEKVREHTGFVLEKAPTSDEAVNAHMLLGDLAYGDHDLEGMEKHFQAVVDLAPESGMADVARNVLRSLERRRERSGD